MSQENVEIVRAAIDAFNRGDWDSVFKDVAPEAEIDMSRAVGPIHGVFRIDRFQGVLADFADNWETLRIEPHDFIEAGEQVVVPWTLHGRGRGGIDVVTRVAIVWTVRDRAIHRFSMYQERQDALEAAGLSE